MDFVREAERHGDTAALCLSHRALGTTYVTMGEFVSGRQHLEKARALYKARGACAILLSIRTDIGATVLCYLCWALWHLGCVDQASEVAAEAVRHADEASHPHTQVYTICHALGMLDIFRRRPEETPSYAGRVVSLCDEHGFPFWAAAGRILNGWAATCQGEAEGGIKQFHDGLAAWRGTGARLWLPMFLALEAEAYAKAGHSETALQIIAEALLVSEETGERWAIAEVLRIKAGLLLATGRPTNEVEAFLVNSLQIARHQHARSWELRTACDLARLWQRDGRGAEALQLIQTIYDQFTEGFDTADLRDAEALQAELEMSESSRSRYGLANPGYVQHDRVVWSRKSRSQWKANPAYDPGAGRRAWTSTRPAWCGWRCCGASGAIDNGGKGSRSTHAGLLRRHDEFNSVTRRNCCSVASG